MRVPRILATALAFPTFLFIATQAAGLEPLRPHEPSDFGPPRQTVREILAAHEGPAIRPLNITAERPSSSVIVLGAANTSGLFGSFFTTDLYVINPHPYGDATVTVYGLLPDRDNIASTPPGFSFSLPARSYFTQQDVLGQLHLGGGAVLLIGGGNQTISAWAYTSTPGTNGGRYGVNIHGIGQVYQDALFDGWCVGANVGDGARTNIGVFNVSSTNTLSLTASVYSVGSSSAVANIPFTVARASFHQVSVGNYAPNVVSGTVWFRDANTAYASYMVVNDNVTNDANFQLATGW